MLRQARIGGRRQGLQIGQRRRRGLGPVAIEFTCHPSVLGETAEQTQAVDATGRMRDRFACGVTFQGLTRCPGIGSPASSQRWFVALLAAIPRPAAAEFFGCEDQHGVRHVSYGQAAPYASHYARAGEAQSSYAQVRPRVTIHPRHQARRICRSWLAKEYRVSRAGDRAAHELPLGIIGAGRRRSRPFISVAISEEQRCRNL